MPNRGIQEIVAGLGALLKSQGLTLGTAESCTGGLIASTLTDVSGSSEWLNGAIVAYSNEIKQEMLGVPKQALIDHGAVSEPVVAAMAQGLCATLGVDCSVAVSGIAGPTGGTPEKPVGTVWMAWHVKGKTFTVKQFFEGSRDEIKLQTVKAAIVGFFEYIEG